MKTSKNKTIFITSLRGGLSDGPVNSDGYEPIQQESFYLARYLDIYSNPKIMTPLLHLGNDAGIPTGNADLLANVVLGSNSKFYFIGKKDISSQVNTVIYSVPRTGAGALSNNSTYTLADNFVDSTPKYTLEEFEDYLYYFKGTTTLRRYGVLSGSPSAGDLSTGLSGAGICLKNHRGLKKLFFAHSKFIGWYDGTTITLQALTLPIGETAVEIESYGRYVLIAANANYGTSKIYIWDGNRTTYEDVIDLGVNSVLTFKNVNGKIYVVTSNLLGTKLLLATPGSTPTVIREIPYVTRFNAGSAAIPTGGVSTVMDDILLFGLTGSSFPSSANYYSGIYSYGTKNIKNPKIFNNQFVMSGTTPYDSVFGLKYIDSEIFVLATSIDGTSYGVWHTRAVSTIGTKTNNGLYQSTVFPIGYQGKIKSILMNHKPLPSNCGFTVSVKHYGHYPLGTSVPSEDSFIAFITTNGAPQGSGSTTGKTQSTDNTTYTYIESPNVFKRANFAQLQIAFDEISTVNAASIIFPIIINLE